MTVSALVYFTSVSFENIGNANVQTYLAVFSLVASLDIVQTGESDDI
jgi:hypothetical protein